MIPKIHYPLRASGSRTGMLGGIAGFVLLIVVAAPALFAAVGHHNDYRALSYDNSLFSLNNPETMAILALGRPLNAILYNVHMSFFRTLEDFAIGRSFSLAVLAACFVIFYRMARQRFGMSSTEALALAFPVFMLPAAQLFIVLNTMLVPGPLTVFVAFVAYALFLRSLPRIDALLAVGPDEPSTSPIRVGALSTTVAIALALWPVFLACLTAMLIYPPSALFFLTLCIGAYLFEADQTAPQRRARLVIALVTTGLAMIAVFALNKLVLFPALQQWSDWYRNESARINSDPTYQFSLVFGGFDHKADIFWKIVKNSAELWNASSDSYLWVASLSITVCAIAAALSRLARHGWRQSARNIIMDVGLLSVAMIATLAPVLLSQQGIEWYRSQYAFSASVLLLVYWAFNRLLRLLPGFTKGAWRVGVTAAATSLLFVVVPASYAFHNISATIRNDRAELQLVRSLLLPALRNGTGYVVFVTGPTSGHFAPVDLKLEFGWTATWPFFVPWHVNGMIPEYSFDADGIGVVTDRNRPTPRSTAPLLVPPRTLLIDLESARLGLQQRIPFTCWIDASSAATGHPIPNLFTGDPNIYWEASSPTPQTIDFECNRSTHLDAFSLYSGTSNVTTIDLPNRWRLEGSNDGREWELIAKGNDDASWLPNEKRRYVANAQQAFRHFRLGFEIEGGNRPLRIYEIRLHAREDQRL